MAQPQLGIQGSFLPEQKSDRGRFGKGEEGRERGKERKKEGEV